jgi:ABC-type antimicrobial peptide transport system permease subunit
VAVVNEHAAHAIAGDENPIGRRLVIEPGSRGGTALDLEIVGVVRDTKYLTLDEPPQSIVYLPLGQDPHPSAGFQLAVRARATSPDLVAGVRRAVEEAVPGALVQFDGLARMIDDSMLRQRLMATLSGFFGLLAAVLAAVGLYGVIAYNVARRTHEFGIRLALGADGKRVARMVVRETLTLLGIGVGAGIGLALAATRLTVSFLYGLEPHDPATFAAAIVLLGTIAVVASLIPARRAAKVDPMVALRDE